MPSPFIYIFIYLLYTYLVILSFPQVWDAMKGEELHSFAHSHIVKSVDFSPDSCQILTGSNEKLLKIFDLNKPEQGELVSVYTNLVTNMFYGLYCIQSIQTNVCNYVYVSNSDKLFPLILFPPVVGE